MARLQERVRRRERGALLQFTAITDQADVFEQIDPA
jgi:hypothetical protein